MQLELTQFYLRNGITLSREPGNLLNRHASKYSGMSSKPVTIVAAEKGVVMTITTKKGKVASTLKGSASHSAKKVRNILSKYRPDLVNAALARISCITKSQVSKKLESMQEDGKKTPLIISRSTASTGGYISSKRIVVPESIKLTLGDTMLSFKDGEWHRESDSLETSLREETSRNEILMSQNQLLEFKLNIVMDMLAMAKLDLVQAQQN